MQLIEKHIIKSNHSYFKELDNLCFLSKNLYNTANYLIRQSFIKEQKYLNYNSLDKLLQKDLNYKALPAKVSQQILKLLDKNWVSYFQANKDYKKNPKKYKGRPKLPRYKDKIKGRNILIYTIQAISKKYLKKKILKLSKTNIELKIKIDNIQDIQQVRIIPRGNFYNIEIIYNFQEKELKEDNERYAGIDLGVNNLATVSFNDIKIKPFIINGRPLKSINQYYNKEKARIQSILEKVNKVKTSKRLTKLSMKRENKINNYLYKSANYIIESLLINEVNTLIIGKNKQWKQDVDLGKKNNQNFVNIPYNKFINILRYKCEKEGINFIEIEESYTSKCSFLDLEELKKHEVYLGKRIKRGLYKSKAGKIINADLNGSLNIIRKYYIKGSKAISKGLNPNEIEGFVVNPIRIKILIK